jgi:23S rRNA (cytidine1920-2'-O)/16S rRNA (cytidine1409-2'-O)-methyltransferase
MASAAKKRLDILVLEKGIAKSRERARSMIMAGNIFVNDELVDKPGTLVDTDAAVFSKESDLIYVSRGGLKLEHALKNFQLNVNDFVCLDVGASTGGFTDCLLRHGAKSVYAVDVGYGQLDWNLRRNPKVIVIERTNIRYISQELLPEPFDLITIDVSFISLKIVIPVVRTFLHKEGIILALIKPQFEVGKGQVGKGGIVKDPALHQFVKNDLSNFFTHMGLMCLGIIPSPILGPKGNIEFLMFLKQP